MQDDRQHLNEIIKTFTKWNISTGSIELDLSPAVERLYGVEDAMNLGGAVGNILYEIEDNRKNSDKKIATKLNPNGSVTVEFLSSGPPLDDETLDTLNRRYNGEIRKGKYIGQMTSGSNWAGIYAKKVNATVRIENCSEGDYTVRNVLTLK